VSRLFFADNTVLINFGLAGRIDTLALILNGQGRWVASVEQEYAASAAKLGLPGPSVMSEFLGESLRPAGNQIFVDILAFQQALRGPGDTREAHLGECETLAIILHQAPDSYILTDDYDAARLADAQGVQTLTTWGLLRFAVKRNLLPALQAWWMVEELRRNGRCSETFARSQTQFNLWVRST